MLNLLGKIKGGGSPTIQKYGKTRKFLQKRRPHSAVIWQSDIREMMSNFKSGVIVLISL